jgi:hypothetical protein
MISGELRSFRRGDGMSASTRAWTYCVAVLVALNSVGCSNEPQPPSKPAVPPAAAPSVSSDADLPPAVDDFVAEEGFALLTLVDFEPFHSEPTTWFEQGEGIQTTGIPKGYLYSKRTFGNFTWRAEFAFLKWKGPPPETYKPDQSNTGFMLCIQEPHKVWPRSLEVQGKFVEMGQIKSNGGVPALVITDDSAARESARKPVGEWNAVEITCRDGAVTATLNGTVVCRSEPGELKEGQIGLQAENYDVMFRRLRIREGQ